MQLRPLTFSVELAGIEREFGGFTSEREVVFARPFGLTDLLLGGL
jgi:hypothetical protein